MLSHKRGYAPVLGPPTTSQPYAFLYKFSVRSGRIHGVAHKPSHHDRLSGEEDISRGLERSNRRMVMFFDNPSRVPPTIADTGDTDQGVREDSPTYDRAIAYGCQVSDTIPKVIVNPRL